MNKVICRLFCLLSIFLPGVIGDIVEKPLNTATNVGNQTAFYCSSNINAGSISWTYTNDCNSANGASLTTSNCDLNSSYSSHYNTEKPDGSHCNLFVFDAVLSLGGCYVCSDGVSAGKQFSAFLIIVDPSASITTNSTDLISGEDVMISCNVSYRGSSIQPPPIPPSFYWTMASDPSQNIPSYPGSPTNTSASSYIVVTAQPPNVPPYLCNLFFNPPTNVPPSGASNAPAYSQSWPTATYSVLFPPQNENINGTPIPCLHQSVELTCSASGYPTPAYKWSDLTGGIILPNSNPVTIERGGSYQCVASNTIRNVLYETSIIANVSDCVPAQNVNITASSGPCASDAASCGEFNSDTLTCTASGFPAPEYEWSFSGDKVTGPKVVAKKNIAYKCTATNYYADQQHSESATLQVFWLTVLICVNLGWSDPACISLLVIVIFFGLNLLFFTIFIICYGCYKSGRNILNERFPWLKRMLPCMNDDGCKCSVWIFYFVLLSIFAAIVFFPTILIMASCCKEKKKKSSQGNMQLNERSGRGAGNTQVNNRGTTPNQSPPRLSVTPNPPSSLHTTVHYQQDPPSRPYPHSSSQQLQPTYSDYTDPYPRNLRQTPSPALSAGGVVYAELGVDNKPMSRRPIQPMINDGNAYADIALA